MKTLPATLEERENGEIFLCRLCPEHGETEALIWRGTPSLASWSRPKKPSPSVMRETDSRLGCPRDCGRCPEHGQHSCTVLFEITGRCNLRCPVCFADAGTGKKAQASFPVLETLLPQLDWIQSHAGGAVLQLSGGEPTLYPELPALVAAARERFPAVQLNTNGLLLADRPEMAEALVKAGLSWVFLQFDGTTDAIFTALRGAPLLPRKLAALENCKKAGLPVVLTPTIAKGINDGDLGNLLRLALSHAPAVRGLHLQPMTRAGRNHLAQCAGDFTLPDVLRAVCEQSQGQMRVEDASPPGCEHERCSFHCRYRVSASGTLAPLRGDAPCCPKPVDTAPGHDAALEGARRSVSTLLRVWQSPEDTEEGAVAPDPFEAFIRQARAHTFSVTCMAFQDAGTVDLERLRGCCVHVYAAPDRLIPFCAYNLTATDGTPLHRPR